MFCEKCGKELVDGAVCKECGYDNENRIYSNLTQAPKKKSGKKKRIIIVTTVIVIVGAGILGYMVYNGPLKTKFASETMVKYVKNREFKKAYDFYGSDIKGKKADTDITSAFLKEIKGKYTDILNEYNKGKLSSNQLEQFDKLLEQISELNIKDRNLNDFIQKYDNLKKSKEFYSYGITCYNDENYSDALDYFKRVIKEDNNYDDAKKKVRIAVEKRIEKEEYVDFIDIINSYSDFYSEKERVELIKKNKKNLTDTVEKKKKDYLNNGKYEDARSYLQEMSYKYPDIEEFADEVNSDSLKQEYIEIVKEQAKKYFDKKEYGKSVSVISVAIKQIGDDNVELNNLYNEYRSYVDTYLDDLDVFNTTGSVYEGDSKDNTGKEHSHSMYLTEGEASYLLEGKYNTISGSIAISYEDRNVNEEYWYEIYGDEKLLYTSKHHTGGAFPEDFSIDISNVNVLKIRVSEEVYNSGKLVLFDTILKRNK